MVGATGGAASSACHCVRNLQRPKCAPPAYLGSDPGWGQSPSQMCTLLHTSVHEKMGAWGQTPGGVSRRHKCARPAYVPAVGQIPGGIRCWVGSVTVTNVHAFPYLSTRLGAHRGSDPGWGQSPSQMCTGALCWVHTTPVGPPATRLPRAGRRPLPATSSCSCAGPSTARSPTQSACQARRRSTPARRQSRWPPGRHRR